jgi:hypothetical protein
VAKVCGSFTIAALLGACSADHGTDLVDGATTVDPTGVYSCAIQAIDDDVFCGGPVYTTRLQGDAVRLTVTRAGGVQAGAWNLLFDGAVDGTRLDLTYRDTTCYSCSTNAGTCARI